MLAKRPLCSLRLSADRLHRSRLRPQYLYLTTWRAHRLAETRLRHYVRRDVFIRCKATAERVAKSYSSSGGTSSGSGWSVSSSGINDRDLLVSIRRYR